MRAVSVRPDSPRRHIPGEPDLWVLIFGDLVAFSALFVAYCVALKTEPVLFRSSQLLLDHGLGLLNTFLLLASSWCVAKAVMLARAGAVGASTFLRGAIFLGLGFVAVKAFEWGAHIRAGHGLNKDSFFRYYYMLTGIHLLHVLIGLGVLTWMNTRFEADGKWRGSVVTLEGGGVFWHLVDLLWVILFALIYLLH